MQLINYLGCLPVFGHEYSNSNTHHFTTESKYSMMGLAQNEKFNVKYVYHEEFHNETLEPINCNESFIYEFVVDKKPLCYHVYNMKRNKHYQNTLPFFYKIYNVSAVKIHKLSRHFGDVFRVFLLILLFSLMLNAYLN